MVWSDARGHSDAACPHVSCRILACSHLQISLRWCSNATSAELHAAGTFLQFTPRRYDPLSWGQEEVRVKVS